MNNFRLKEIIFSWSHTTWKKVEKATLFQRIDNQPINIFYFQNGYGKSTLYQILNKVICFEKTIPTDLIKLNNKDYQIDEILVKVKLKEDLYTLTYRKKFPNSTTLEIANIDEKWFGIDALSNRVEKEIYNQNNPLIYITLDKKTQRRTTIESLARFNFLDDESYYHQKSKECDLADTHKDGEWKRVLFNYILWEDLSDMPLDIMQQVWTHKKLTSNILPELERQYAKLPNDEEDGLFGDIFKEQQSQLISQEAELKDYKIIKKDAEFWLLKIKDLLSNTQILEKHQYVKTFLEKEREFLLTFISNVDQKVDEIFSKIKLNAPNMADLVHQISEREALKSRIEETTSYIKNTLSAVRRYEDRPRDVLYSAYQSIYDPLLSKAGYKWNASLNNKTLKVILRTGDKLWDGHLRLARLLYLVALQLYKKTFTKARTLGVWFFDAPFYGVTLTNVVTFFDSIVDYYKKHQADTQLFFFMTRITDYENNDHLEKFIQDNNQYIYNHPRNKKTNKMFTTE